ncbi:IS66 family insertion sequence element accessory protein TnpA [Endozoicomonas acroporae]|uniref:IS66 family insertion sequence element accessory protein TnpA n=1 Tax=Endozoicomonas acroporae TaxID=1701104 RepID=UPI003B8391E9
MHGGSDDHPEITKEQWLQRIEAWHDSGLSQKAWCRQNGVRPSQLGYWKKKLCAGISRISRSGGVGYYAG